MEIHLNTPILDFPGIGPARAQKLAKLGIATAGDLLRCFPRNYEDRRSVSSIADAPVDEPVCIQALVAEMPRLSRIRRGLELVKVKVVDKVLKKVDDLDFFPFLLTAVLGMILGAIKIPGINFSLGSSGGALIMGLIVGHFGHIGKIDLSVSKSTLNFFRELGLMLFLVGAGVPGGVNFMTYVKLSYFIYGAIMTLMPMIIGFILAKFVFKLSVFNNLGSITGGMTSTPALGALISTAGTDDVASAYASTYPIALVFVVLAAKIILMVF